MKSGICTGILVCIMYTVLMWYVGSHFGSMGTVFCSGNVLMISAYTTIPYQTRVDGTVATKYS